MLMQKYLFNSLKCFIYERLGQATTCQTSERLNNCPRSLMLLLKMKSLRQTHYTLLNIGKFILTPLLIFLKG